MAGGFGCALTGAAIGAGGLGDGVVAGGLGDGVVAGGLGDGVLAGLAVAAGGGGGLGLPPSVLVTAVVGVVLGAAAPPFGGSLHRSSLEKRQGIKYNIQQRLGAAQ